MTTGPGRPVRASSKALRTVSSSRSGSASRLLGYVPQYPSFPRDFPITVEQVVQLGRLGLGQKGNWWQALWPGRVSGTDREAVRRALAEVEAEIADLRSKINRIGAVNVDALAEIDELQPIDMHGARE